MELGVDYRFRVLVNHLYFSASRQTPQPRQAGLRACVTASYGPLGIVVYDDRTWEVRYDRGNRGVCVLGKGEAYIGDFDKACLLAAQQAAELGYNLF